MPLLNGFIGEFTILRGIFEVKWQYAAWGVIGVVLGAAYLLWLYQRVMFGNITNPLNEHLPDLNGREWATLLPLVFLAFWIGIYPAPLFHVLEAPVDRLMRTVNPGYLPPAVPAALMDAPLPAAHGRSSSGSAGARGQIARRAKAKQARGQIDGLARHPSAIARSTSPSSFLRAMLVFVALAILLTDFFLTPAQKGWNAITAMLGVIFSGAALGHHLEKSSGSALLGLRQLHRHRSVLHLF